MISGQWLSYAEYLERLRQVPVDEYLVTDPDDAYPRGVAEAVLLSLDAVTGQVQAGETGRAVLELVSVLSPSGIPRSLLRAAAKSGMLPGCEGLAGVRGASRADQGHEGSGCVVGEPGRCS